MHCSCDVPGEVLVLPREGGPNQFSNERFDVVYSARSILAHYAEMRGEVPVPKETWERLDTFPSHPFVIRVREGEERETALRLSGDRRVRASVPNVAISPATASLATPEVFDVIRRHHAEAAASVCGTGVRVAVLDTGIDAGLVPSCKSQYDVVTPGTSLVPSDADGHGSVVAAIIREIVPAAAILSVKVFPNGTLGGLVVGMQIALAVFEPHVINLSLGLDVSRDRCRKCGYPNGQQFPEKLVHSFFQTVDTHGSHVKPLVVAAAGNESRLLLPARCDTVLAVGAYDEITADRSDYARYPRVPASRFVMADGGTAARPLGNAGWGKPLYGTSFSAAIATGVAARFACAYVGQNPCSRIPRGPFVHLGRTLLAEIQQTASLVPNHAQNIHGFGIVQYRHW